MKIDCHLHLPVRDNLRDIDAQKAYLLQELPAHGIDYGIVIPDNVPESNIGSLQQCLHLFQNEKSIFVMPSINILREPISHVDEFDDLFKKRRIVGLKIFPGHEEHYPNDARLNPFIALCRKYDAPFVVHTGWNKGNPGVAKWNDPKYIVEIADKYPDLKIVIAHYFWPEMEYCYQTTRRYKNIFFDTSGLASRTLEDATGKETVQAVLERTIADKPNGVVLGSDFGMCRLSAHIALIDRLHISDKLKEDIYWQNAVDLFHLEIDA